MALDGPSADGIAVVDEHSGSVGRGTTSWGARVVAVLAFVWLAGFGLLLAFGVLGAALDSDWGLLLGFALVLVVWVVLILVSVGRVRSGRGGVWRVALVSPFVLVLPLLLLRRQVRQGVVDDLRSAVRGARAHVPVHAVEIGGARVDLPAQATGRAGQIAARSVDRERLPGRGIVVAYFPGEPGMDPLAEAREWADWLHERGFGAVVSLERVPRSFRGSRKWSSGAALSVPVGEEESAFARLVDAGGDLRLCWPGERPDVLAGEEVLFETTDKKDVITATRVFTSGGRCLRVVERPCVTGVDQRSSGDSTSLHLTVRDWRGREGRWYVGSGELVGRPELLSVGAPELVQSVFDQVVDGRATGEVAKQLKRERELGITWNIGAVRRLITSTEFDRGVSPLGVVSSGTWAQAQQSLEREKAARGFVLEHWRRVAGWIIPAAVVLGVGYLVVSGIRNALIPQGSTRSKPIWLGHHATIGDGWQMEVLSATATGPSATSRQLVTMLRLTNIGVLDRSTTEVLSRLRAEGIHRAVYPSSSCGTSTATLPRQTVAGGHTDAARDCFHMPVTDPSKIMLLFEPTPTKNSKTVWFALRKEPQSNGDGGD